MKNKTNWWLIAGIVVVVAVIASLITLQVTGNVVRVTNTDRTACYNACVADSCSNMTRTTLNRCKSSCSSSCSKVDVYTKAEVDALLANIGGSGNGITKQEALSLLNEKCEFIGYMPGSWISGDEACSAVIPNSTCVLVKARNFQGSNNTPVEFLSACKYKVNPAAIRNTDDFTAMCCSA